MSKELVIDLFDETSEGNEALAKLLDGSRWSDLITRFKAGPKDEEEAPVGPRKSRTHRFELVDETEEDANAGARSEEFLGSLVQELVEGT